MVRSAPLALVSLITLLIWAGAADCATTIYGLTGLIETPDDSIVSLHGAELSLNYVNDFNGTNENLLLYGGVVGLLPGLEAGATLLQSSVDGKRSEGLLNWKYRIASEQRVRPSLTVGFVDLVNQLDKVNPEIHNSSFFAVFGKTLGATEPGRLKVTAGFGTGLYNSGFAGAQWRAAPKTDLVVEYLSKGLRQSTTVSAALRYSVAEVSTLQLGTIGFESFYAGGSYAFRF